MGTTLAVIGASGRTGRELLVAADAAGHDTVAVVRDPARLAAPSTRVAVADVRSAGQLADALDGVDAVAFCVGSVGKEPRTAQGDGIAACLTAMRRAGVTRLVAISASGGVVVGDDPLNRYLAKPIVGRLLRNTYTDMARMERTIEASGTDWTILRPPRLTDGAARGHYQARREGNVRWSYQVTRADLARAVLDALADPTTVGATISVAG